MDIKKDELDVKSQDENTNFSKEILHQSQTVDLNTSTSTEHVNCRICCYLREKKDMITHSCGTQTCRTCLATALQTRIASSSNLEILCMSCDSAFTTEQEQLITQNTNILQKLKRLRRLQEVRRAGKDGVFCPNPKCGFGVVLDNASVHVVCEECGFDFCSSPTCLLPCHPDLTCHEAKRREKQRTTTPTLSFSQKMEKGTTKMVNFFQDALSTLRVLMVTKKCPGCGHGIEKNGGCNHLQCASCQIDFCWSCGKRSYYHDDAGGACKPENSLLEPPVLTSVIILSVVVIVPIVTTAVILENTYNS
eukprot:TRINITY_DN11866_c0_g1_i1.p1 TRINITY_DN11866_c0_g1~~TRINITY_DN11866_c0_g1_i1.p1  ORF type:complete len:315 (+),score=67.81 TRINITY_DN11866_c0_g1_i1:28-945(+)